jgi:hypothetical protein
MTEREADMPEQEGPYKRLKNWITKPNGAVLDLNWFQGQGEDTYEEILDAYAQGRKSLEAELAQVRKLLEEESAFFVGLVHELFRALDSVGSSSPAPKEFIEAHQKLYLEKLEEIRRREGLGGQV